MEQKVGSLVSREEFKDGRFSVGCMWGQLGWTQKCTTQIPLKEELVAPAAKSMVSGQPKAVSPFRIASAAESHLAQSQTLPVAADIQ